MKTHSFFGTLGHLAGSGRQETQLSRTFQACFEWSPFVRQQILDLLREVCRIKKRVPMQELWDCAVEVPTPRQGGGRVDMRIGPAGAANSLPRFYLESKVESPLTLEQLRRYRQYGVEYLIAVTKYPPEISRQAVSEHGVFVLRWQDIHRRLRGGASRGSDQFIAHSLADYLEELGMAYREDVRVEDLELCRRFLSTVADPQCQYREMSLRNGFDVADACLQLLRDLRDRFVERHPQLTDYSSWGPGYFTWFDEDQNRYHAFSWLLFKERSKATFSGRFWLPDSHEEPVQWGLWLGGAAVKNRSASWPLESLVTRDGTIDQDKLLASLGKYAKSWGFVCQDTAAKTR